MDYGQQLAVMYSESRRPDLKEKLIDQYRELVYSRAHVYSNGNNFDELVAAGLLALNRVADDYSTAKGGKFITIATEFINGYMLHHLRDNKSCIKNPTNIESDAYYYVRKLATLGLTPDDEVNLAEVAKKVGVPLEKLLKCQKAYKARTSTVDFTSLVHTGQDVDKDSYAYDIVRNLEGLWTNIDGDAWNNGPDKEEVIVMTKIMSHHKDGMTASWIARKLDLDVELVRRCVKECSKVSVPA